MNSVEQRAAAKAFIKKWTDKGDEKQDSQSFWIELLMSVFDVENPTDYISFEKTVKIDGHTKFIDGYIADTKVLIEQKGTNIDLEKAYTQSGGQMMTPFQQARNYANYLPHDEHPRWIIVSNFKCFHIHDMNHPNEKPEVVYLKDLEKEYYRLQFIVNQRDENIRREMEVSMRAGEIVGELYDKIKEQYPQPDDEETLKSLNVLCVRLVFCLYAEDAGLFGRKNMFYDYVNDFEPKYLRRAFIDLFKTLDTRVEDRDRNLEFELAEFPYVNGGLFADENIEIPQFTEEIKDLLLDEASKSFDWSEISPTIFGAVFESTLNPETRRSGGMHYTSIENIHKVIDPLFLDQLEDEFAEIKAISVNKTKLDRLERLHDKIAGLSFLDPACGSGNFLTESYLSLRRLENSIVEAKIEATKGLLSGQIAMGGLNEEANPIRVSIGQFYGIEINDFAVTVAKTAMWIAESQMMKATEDIIHMKLDFLPLSSFANIVEGNALRMDWETVVSKDKLNYIMGNPPFVGGMQMKDRQKKDTVELFSELKGAGELDYVCGWYMKAVQYIKGHNIFCAFVSTNSICQGSQVITFWKYLFDNFKININYAFTTFDWNSEAKNQAKVHCVIVGFSVGCEMKKKKIFSDDGSVKYCEYISPYLSDIPVNFIESRSKPLCNVPEMRFGSMPRDGGGFVLSPEEREHFIKGNPLCEKWIKPYIGAEEFLKGKERYCLWLVDADPTELKKCSMVMERIEHVRSFRMASKAAGTRKFAETPTVFCQIAQPNSNYILVPKTSSGKRKYVPLGFKDKGTIASDLVFLIPNAGLFEFGILMSNVHNAWIRLVAGRLKSDYRYSKDIVYNNFPWPDVTSEQRKKIEATAQGILDAREQYGDATLTELYGEKMYLYTELVKAHRENDRAVLQAYDFPISASKFGEADCVAKLMELYEEYEKSTE